MFTGIIESRGRIEQAQAVQGGRRLRVRPEPFLAGLAIGESIATNGVCLTAEPGSTPERLTFFLSTETLARTTLGDLAPGDHLNLERALRADSHLGGHLVMGHVDGVGEIRRWDARGETSELEIAFPPELAPFLAAKGSVAVDGISLTLAELRADSFTVAVIPHTVAMTNLAQAKPGRRVNLEADVLARYVVRALEVLRPGAPGTKLSADFLRQAGF